MCPHSHLHGFLANSVKKKMQGKKCEGKMRAEAPEFRFSSGQIPLKNNQLHPLNHEEKGRPSCLVKNDTMCDTNIISKAENQSLHPSSSLRTTAKEFISSTNLEGQSALFCSTAASSDSKCISPDPNRCNLRPTAIPFNPQQIQPGNTTHPEMIGSSSTKLRSEAESFHYDVNQTNGFQDHFSLNSGKLPMEQILPGYPLKTIGLDEYTTMPSTAFFFNGNHSTYIPAAARSSKESSHLSADIQSSNPQTRPLCHFFAMGACRKGIDCPFLHDSSQAVNVLSNLQQEELFNNSQHGKIPNPYMMEEGIEVVFDSGASVVELLLGIRDKDGSNGEENCKTIVISGLSNQVTEDYLKLFFSKFGEITFVDLKKSLDGSSSYAHLSYPNGQSALDSIEAMNGHPLDFYPANQKMVDKKKGGKSKYLLHSSPVVSVALKQIKSPLRSQTSNATCKVQWYAPSRCALAYLKTRSDADKITTSCNNQKLQDRVIITGFKAPRSYIGRYGRTFRHKPSSFTVWLGNLDESVTKADLVQFIYQFAKIKVDSVSIGELSFKESESAQIIRTLLERHGPVVSIELGKERLKTTDLKRKALVRFANDEHAQKACQHFQHVQKVDELGGSRLYIQRIVTLKYTFPENTLDALKSFIQNVLHEFPSVRHTFYDNMRSKTILISADDSIILEALKLRLEPLIRGEVVKERKGGSILWNNFLSSNEFKNKVIQEFGHDVSATIWCDRRRREVRVFGPSEHRLKTIKCVQQLCDERILATFSVPVTEDQYKYILQAGRSFLDRLKLATACRKVSVDLKNKALLVEGGETEASRMMSQVSRLIIKGSSEDIINYDTFCPICFCPPDEETVSPCDSVRLLCKHVYCSDCFRYWLTGFNTCEFPLRCLSDGCNKLVSLDDIGKNLNGEILASFLRSSFDDYIRKNLVQYQFCIVPTCPGVYEIKNSVCRSVCSTCSLIVCTNCNASHGAMTCQQYKLSTLPPDQLRMQIVDDILTLRCPRCKQAFLDFDGCFAISCHACPCNFCGWCLMDCQSDAHPHVKECRYRHPKAQSYFGSQIQFQQAQNKKRVEKLKIFLKDYTVANKVAILESIKNDLVDLGISTEMLV